MTNDIMWPGQVQPILPEKPAIGLDDVEGLIEQLEGQFEESEMLTMGADAGTQGCTNAGGCTGTCPCENPILPNPS
ncbi:hypothetical protein G5C51_00785 [Streptomyces sp. A7024]|uniref:Uncharacterized protein n=1 Tax=Streptomyces coryli TaxID=1128680 RepID=A0A6G4TTU5_9ACTN|nr:hypothetical protein [Streptomyces coryli]NGN62447.1 hypothetical protein [Streptomyces coryli]